MRIVYNIVLDHSRACPEHVCERNTFDGTKDKVCQRRESESLAKTEDRRIGIRGKDVIPRRPKRMRRENDPKVREERREIKEEMVGRKG